VFEDAGVTDFWLAVSRFINRQFIPLATCVNDVQNVVKYFIQWRC